MPETSCMKVTSLHLQIRRIKQLRNRKVRDFVMPLRARKVSGAFEKRAPSLKEIKEMLLSVQCSLRNVQLENRMMAGELAEDPRLLSCANTEEPLELHGITANVSILLRKLWSLSLTDICYIMQKTNQIENVIVKIRSHKINTNLYRK